MIVVLALLALDHAQLAAANDDRADQLKAAYTLNFMKFVEWPAEGTTDLALRVVVIGDGSIAAAVRVAVEGKTVQGRQVSVTAFSNAASWRVSNTHCQMIFATSSSRSNWDELLHELADKPVLTISDGDGFCVLGGMLGLFETENRIRFEANPAAAAVAGLKIRSELLKLATITKTEGPTH